MDVRPCKHVKGRQEDKPDTPWPEKLNIYADKLATEALRQIKTTQKKYWFPLPAAKAYLYCQTLVVTSKTIETLESTLNEQPLQEYPSKRHNWVKKTMDDIDLTAFRGARRKYSQDKSVFITKLCIKWLPTAHHLAKQQPLASGLCIHCQEIETQSHMFQCKSRARQKWKTVFIGKLEEHLRKAKTDPLVRTALIRGADRWLEKDQNHTSSNIQEDIGWECFMYGYIAAEWGHRQELFLRGKPQRREKHNVVHMGDEAHYVPVDTSSRPAARTQCLGSQR